MHDTAMQNAKFFIETYLDGDKKIKLIDIGSQNVTGSVKDVCKSNIDYTGVDFVDGNGVDLVLDDPYSLPFLDNTFDAVTASSCFEHSEFFWELFIEMLRITKPNGLIYLNVPSNGRYHKYPVDCWRFYLDSGIALTNYGNKKGYDCLLLESYISRQVRLWNDFVCVIVRDRACAGNHTQRITSKYDNYDNGRILIEKNEKLIICRTKENEIPEDQRFLGWKVSKLIHRIAAKFLCLFGWQRSGC